MRPISLILIAGLAIFSANDYSQADQANCTMVIGFTQTADWYLAPAFRNTNPASGAIFESLVGDAQWQLK